MHQRNERLINAKINQYLFPGIMMALSLQLGNILDTIMVGNFLGTDAMTAVSLSMPVETILQIPGYCLGTGGAIAAGVMLGRRERKKASELFTVTFVVTFLAGLLFSLLAFLAADPLARLLASKAGVAQLTRDYILVSMLGAPFIGIGLLMSSYLGAENHPQLASAYLIISNVINLILDFIFLKYTSMGTMGAALSTVLGFAVGMVVFVAYIRSPKRMIGFVRSPSVSIIKEALVTGMPIFVFMAMSFVKSLGLNTIIVSLTGQAGMAIYTVCDNILMIVEMLSGGIIGIIPNMAGILYGEKDYYGIRVLCKKTLQYSFWVVSAAFLAVMVFTPQVTRLFGITEPALQGEMSAALRLFLFSLPVYLWNKFLISYYESIEETAQASLLTFLQNCFYVLPAAFAGIYISQALGGTGVNGLALSFACAEALTALTAYLYRKIKYKGCDFYILPKDNEGTSLDLSVAATLEEAVKIPQELVNFCREQGVPMRTANFAAVAAEEMMANSIRYGGKSVHWIDINLVVEEEEMRLRIRDNGIPFNPVEYRFDSGEYEIHGIELVKRMSSHVDYMRTMDMNNTIIAFQRQEEKDGKQKR
ncbi:MAG: hypothetical protein HFI75_09645 [Lachnospiraceae bacterium]|nr:hypothetical protein [Lachnospiraceae bacterium]